MSITIKDVARHAGVSTATISRAINDDPKVTPETRQKVFESIAELDYKINTIARSLKLNKTFTIGFISPRMADEFYMSVAESVEKELRAHGYSLIICSSNESMERESEHIRLLMEKCVDGLIIIPSSNRGSHFETILKQDVPLVLIDRLVDDFTTDSVLVDNENGAYQAVEALIKSGIRRIGFIGGDMRLSSARERCNGYIRALNDGKIPLDNDIIKFGDYHVQSGYNLIKELLETDADLSDIFISNYEMHIGATKYLIEHKSALKHPISIASFDDMELSFILGFSSVRIRQPIQEIGIQAADLILKRIEKEDLPFPQIVRLKTELIGN